MTKIKIKNIGVLSLGKIYGILSALGGLIIGALFTLVGIAIPTVSSYALFGVGAVVILPVIYGVFGFIAGIIAASLYNAVAKRIGGLEIETGK